MQANMITVRSLPVHLMPSPVPPFLQGSYIFHGLKHPHLSDWVLPTSLNQCRYSPFFKLLKSGLLSTEAEGRTERKIQRNNHKQKEQVLYSTLSLVQTRVFKRPKAVVECSCSIPVPVQHCALCSHSAVLCYDTA